MKRRWNGRALIVAVAAGALMAPAANASPILGFSERSVQAQRTYEQRFQRGLSAASIRRTSRALSRRPRPTGSPGLRRAFAYSVARLRSYGLRVSTPRYSVYTSHARDVSVTMTAPYTRRLANRERGYGEIAYNAYSPSGDVSGEVVSVGRGLPADYANLDVRGRIVLVRYGGGYRGAKVERAEAHGAAGVLFYSDTAVADGIQRGTIEYLFRYPGDPLTPGVAALPGARRTAAANLPRIPAAPIGSGDARALLDAPGARVRLRVDMAYEQTPVRDIVATIRGARRPREKVIVGGHYDAWTYGASDNASGWAAIMEIGRSLGRLAARGLRPDRTIVLAGWDGEEHGMLGSTEWVEQHRRDLARHAIAYFNLDQAGGTRFYASGTPQLDDALIETTKAVTDPRTSRSVYDVWKAYERGAPALGRLGSGSDYTAFLDHAGVPTLDGGFSSPAGMGTYHSAYDNTRNLERHLDPGYLGHLGSARVAGVMALRLANADVLPFHYSDYASAILSYGPPPELRRAAEAWQRAARRLEARATARANAALLRQERALTSPAGLPGRPWFRHLVYVPSLTSGYDVEYLPGPPDRLLAALRRATRLAG